MKDRLNEEEYILVYKNTLSQSYREIYCFCHVNTISEPKVPAHLVAHVETCSVDPQSSN